MTAEPNQKMTLWVWPSGLFPRRVVYYLKAKQLPSSVLRDLEIIPVFLSKEGAGLVTMRDSQDRPEAFSLPILQSGQGVQRRTVAQSSSILEYLEELFPPSEGFIGLNGTDLEHRGHIRDIVNMVNEILVWVNVHLRHANELSRSWTGMTKEQQSREAADDAIKQAKICMAKLELWTKVNRDKGNLSIAGGNIPTLADFSFAAGISYMEEMYNWVIIDGFDGLRHWFDGYCKSEWFVSREEIDRIESEGFSSLFCDNDSFRSN